MKFNVTSNGLIFFKKKDGITIEQNFPLKEISEDEIIEHRLSDVPGFILKKGDKLYYSEIPNNSRLSNNEITEIHLCSSLSKTCKHLSAALECDGGCQKVRDISIDSYPKERLDYFSKLISAKRIEKYPFVTYGYETFNTVHNCLVVMECKNNEKAK